MESGRPLFLQCSRLEWAGWNVLDAPEAFRAARLFTSCQNVGKPLSSLFPQYFSTNRSTKFSSAYSLEFGRGFAEGLVWSLRSPQIPPQVYRYRFVVTSAMDAGNRCDVLSDSIVRFTYWSICLVFFGTILNCQRAKTQHRMQVSAQWWTSSRGLHQSR